MPSSDTSQHDQSNARHYKQLGLDLGSTMRDVETAYWRIARELKGQPAMAAYNVAYEALVSKARRPTDNAVTQPPPAVIGELKDAPASRRPSKLGWPT